MQGLIVDPGGLGSHYARTARVYIAAGIRADDIAHNTFAYYPTPGG